MGGCEPYSSFLGMLRSSMKQTAFSLVFLGLNLFLARLSKLLSMTSCVLLELVPAEKLIVKESSSWLSSAKRVFSISTVLPTPEFPTKRMWCCFYRSAWATNRLRAQSIVWM